MQEGKSSCYLITLLEFLILERSTDRKRITIKLNQMLSLKQQEEMTTKEIVEEALTETTSQ